MTPSKPYLIRAFFDWIVDNELTPYMLVDTRVPGVLVPEDYIEDGRILLNVNPSAVRNLVMGNELIHFGARFGGRPFELSFPPSAVGAVYAKENGKGMLFDTGDEPDGPNPEGPGSGPGQGSEDTPPPDKRPRLKVVK